MTARVSESIVVSLECLLDKTGIVDALREARAGRGA
jgi:hypothetical protein